MLNTKQNLPKSYLRMSKELCICPKDAYMGDMNFHPIFETEADAIKYIEGLKFGHGLKPVELSVYST